jgi:uncharacterized membrane protein HdeD (DUF308 family)
VSLLKKLLVFAVALVALGVFVGTASYSLTHDEAAGWIAVTALLSLLAGAFALGSELKTDPDAALTFLSVFLLLMALCEVIYLFSARSPGWVPKAAAAVSGLGAVGLGVVTYRRQHGPGSPEFPNVLRTELGAAGILETNGVQFAALVEPGIGSQPHWASILVQNCFDGARTVRIRFDAEGHAKYLRHWPELTARLGPAEVRELRLPVISPTYPGEYHLYFSVGVDGTGGRRVRPWRAPAPTTRVQGGASVALLAAGVLAYGGGLKLEIGPLEADLWTEELPAPVNELVWQPTFGTVPTS